MEASATTQPALTAFSFHSDHLGEMIKHGMKQSELLGLCQTLNAAAAVILLLAGVVFLLWGYYAFKTLVILNAAVIGAWMGYLAGQGSDAAVPGAMVGAFIAAAMAWPMMKYAVAIMGGLIGAMIGMTIWRTSGLDPTYSAAGGGMGLIFCGLISFILFRTSVMMFTAVQGAGMLTIGVLCLLYKVRLVDTSALNAKLIATPTAMPMVILLAAVVGILYQNSDTVKPVEAK